MRKALGRLKRASDSESLWLTAAAELCGTGVFDRVMLSRVDRSVWLPRAMFVVDRIHVVRAVDDESVTELSIPLVSPLVEAEVVRRRAPAMVQDADREPRVFGPLCRRTGAREYVVAPLVSGGMVVGLLHADVAATGRSLRVVDRTFIGMFADAVGVIHESGLLGETAQRLQLSAADLGESVARSAGKITFLAQTGRDVDRPQSTRLMKFDAPPRPTPDRVAVLTKREREVLALLASGATNAELADQLTLAESTVKSHVKHILRKLGASNRSTAIAMYLRETLERERGFH